MIWLKGLLVARWSRYAIAGMAVAAVLAYAHGRIYQKGYAAAEAEYIAKMNAALSAQLDNLVAQHNRQLAALMKKNQRTEQARRAISEIPAPDTDDCNHPDWVRAYNDAVRAANAS